jgi:hypothetical protein
MGMGSRVQRIVIGVADQNGLREQCADAAQAIMFVFKSIYWTFSGILRAFKVFSASGKCARHASKIPCEDPLLEPFPSENEGSYRAWIRTMTNASKGR